MISRLDRLDRLDRGIEIEREKERDGGKADISIQPDGRDKQTGMCVGRGRVCVCVSGRTGFGKG